MNIRRHFRTSQSTIDYIISDFSFNRISDKEAYFKFCVNSRMQILNNNYNNKLDKILDYIIKHCNYDNLPINSLSRIILSISKVTNALSKGFLSLISNQGDDI